jgi:hypothetical protein
MLFFGCLHRIYKKGPIPNFDEQGEQDGGQCGLRVDHHLTIFKHNLLIPGQKPARPLGLLPYPTTITPAARPNRPPATTAFHHIFILIYLSGFV